MSLMYETCLRDLVEQDADELLMMFHEMAEDIHLPHPVTATRQDILSNFLGRGAIGHAFLLEHEEKTIGYVTSYLGVSSSSSKPSFHLDDIYIRGRWRGLGIGKTVMDELIRIAQKVGCHSLTWQVLKRNTSAIAFYDALGCDISGDYLHCELSILSRS